MGRSKETYSKKEVRNKKAKKREEKEKKKLARKENEKNSSLDDMIAYVDENGMITSSPPDPTKKTEIELEDIETSIPKHNPAHNTDPIRQGTVSFFNESKGYGFIKDAETKQSIFVHINNVVDTIKEGDLVSFEVVSGKKGPNATEVTILKSDQTNS